MQRKKEWEQESTCLGDISINTIKRLSESQIVKLVVILAVFLSLQICIRICEGEESSDVLYLERFCNNARLF